MRSPSPSFSACELSDLESFPDLNDSIRSALILPPPGHWARGLELAHESSGETEDKRPHLLARRRKLRHRSRSRSPSNRPSVRRRLTFPRTATRAACGMANLGGNYDGTVSDCDDCARLSLTGTLDSES
jgi:hypothetical protein